MRTVMWPEKPAYMEDWEAFASTVMNVSGKAATMREIETVMKHRGWKPVRIVFERIEESS